MTSVQQRHIVGRAVRSLRERRDQPRSWLAVQCHLSASHLRNIENGHRLPSADDTASIEKALGTGGLLKDLINCGDDVRRRTILQSLAMLGAAFPELAHRPHANAGSVRSMTAHLRTLDNAHGGVHSHHAIAGYLHNIALPAAAGDDHQLRSAVAELTLLTGWTAYDAGAQSAAGAYFSQAKSLADDAGDLALTGEVLAAMSHQAAFLGRGDLAISHADAALAAAVRAGMHALAAEAHMSAAHGAAIAGDNRQTAILLSRAARDLDRADRGNAPEWSSHLSGAYLDARTGHSLLAAGDLPGAVAAARASLDMDDGYDRGKMFNLALLSTALLEAREIDEACVVGRRALDAAGNLNSDRAEEYMRRIALRLMDYRDHDDAAVLLTDIGSHLVPTEQDGLETDD